MKQNLDQLIDNLLADFSPKQRRVIVGRFGLKTGERSTLQFIGDELKITRERVRQIEEQAIKKLSKKVKEEAAVILDYARKHLAGVGGVKRDDNFMNDLIHGLEIGADVKHADQKLRFILLVAGVPSYSKNDDNAQAFWFSDEKSKEKFHDFIKTVTNFLKSGKKEEILNKKLYLNHMKDLVSAHLLSIPKHFGTNIFGDFGLKEWPEIEPKTIRDKVYLVLKKHERPLHFGDIAKNINKFGLDKKPAHVQTVHNELIKDNRFVLVGRGVYALKEKGYEPGTVREVIARLLKKHGSLESATVVRLVNEQRLLKENTILLNLQNRRYFKRLDSGKYQVREA
ncbi:MAG: sigma factor-like helix-turn-helix DNA-binding protein [Patescibacteria group bacterium]